jgi:hypothetical protein
MTILHFIPSIDTTDGIISKYMAVLCSETGMLSDVHVACAKSANPIEMNHVTIHYLKYGNNYYRMRLQWLKLLYEVMPDIVHVHGCWSLYGAMAILLAQKRGFRTLLSPHGELEPWIIKQRLFKEKIPKIIGYQWKAVRHCFAVQVMGNIEYDNLLSLKWNKRIVKVSNSLVTNSIDNQSMAQAMIALYRKILDTEVYCLMDKKTKEAFSSLMYAGITGNKLADFPKIDNNIWRQMMIFAHTEGISDIFIKGCELQPYAYPDINMKAIDVFKKDILQNSEPKDGKSMEWIVISLFKYVHKNVFRYKLQLNDLCRLAELLRNNDYDEAIVKEMLQKNKITKFAGRIEQILNELVGLEEGFMPVPRINDFLTEKIKKILIKNLTI